MKFIILFLILHIKSECGTLNDTRCQGCEQAETCSSCYQSYWDGTEKKCVVPKTKIEGCKIYKDESICFECSFGYYIKYNPSKCIKITIKNCLTAVQDGECIICNSTYVSGDKKTCSDTKCRYKNCKGCHRLEVSPGSFKEMCIWCQNGFVLKDFIDNSCISNTKNCGKLNFHDLKCVLCKGGFYMNKNDCVKSDIIPLGIDGENVVVENNDDVVENNDDVLENNDDFVETTDDNVNNENIDDLVKNIDVNKNFVMKLVVFAFGVFVMLF